ncbi:MAG: nucleotidyl transferase AbiEii/AbiGii toxin family protein [Bacteroidales bacterium]|nr:nucleotidyl transferase AbiEii/AbiGii toxin family protein [Bacteroidales bacterium]
MNRNKWTQLPNTEKIEAINKVALTEGLPSVAVEKDWWVTMSLRALFSCQCAEHIVFKGGTSLSKAWKVIERFSEDIDIAIDRNFFGFDGELTRKQITNLRRASCAYISTVLKEELDEKLQELGIEGYFVSIRETKDTTQDPQIIEIKYNSIFSPNNYIQEKVLIEIGARSLLEPSENIRLRSMIAEVYPDADFADTFIEIPTVVPQRTFLEKAFLLHEEFQKPTGTIRVDRMSRHLYDLEKLMNTAFAESALADTELYLTIVNHRKHLTAIKGVDYSTHSPDKINFVPPNAIVEKWKNDYETMLGNMTYGDSLPFDKLLEKIRLLNEKFRDIPLRFGKLNK